MYKIKINDKINYNINDKMNDNIDDNPIINDIKTEIRSSLSSIKEIKKNIIYVNNRLPTSYLTMDIVYRKLYKLFNNINDNNNDHYDNINLLIYTSLYLCDYYVQKEDIRFVSMYVCRKYIDKHYKYNKLKYHIIMDITYNNIYDIFIKNTTIIKQPNRCIIL